MKMAILFALFVAIVGQFMADEVKAWFGWLHVKLRRSAVAKLPNECRDRYDEEWEGAIEEIPGEIFKTVYSLGLLRAAFGIRKTALRDAANSKDGLASFKRTFDIVFSSLILILLAPILLAIAIALKIDSPGPVFYRSERIGKKGRKFFCFKFRTMVLDADSSHPNFVHLYERDGVLFRISSDPRITPLGRFLRKYSLDELPQFFNVIKGEMTIVGPRPPIASEVHEYKLSHLPQINLTPGITGLWQVHRHKNPSSANYVALIEAYIKNMSLWTDIKIILRTIGVFFAGTGT